MAIRDLIPAGRRSSLVRRGGSNSLAELRREMDRLFDDFFAGSGFDLPDLAALAKGTSWPRVNVAESDRDVVVTAELPGVDERDISVSLHGDLLSISGDVNEEQTERGRRWTKTERVTGRFERSVQLPASVLADQVKATYKRGVLSVTLAKDENRAEPRKKIPIQAD